jgi:hypothetical protein
MWFVDSNIYPTLAPGKLCLVPSVSHHTRIDVVQAAKAQSPSIIFIDEIDAIGGKRLVLCGGASCLDRTLLR